MLSGLQLTWRSVGKIVAVVATALTIRVFALAIYEGRSQQSPDQPAQRVTDMAGSSATLYIDDLPGNLDHIVQLLQESNGPVSIVLDHAIHGLYSDQQAFFRYEEAVKSLGANARISLFNTKAARSSFEQYFPQIDEIKADPRFETFVRYHLNSFCNTGPAKEIDTEKISQEHFIDMLVRENCQTARRFKASGARVYYSPDPYTLLFWIAEPLEEGSTEGAQAILSTSPLSNTLRAEISFQTTDDDAIENLRKIASDGFRSGNETGSACPEEPLKTCKFE